MDEVSATVLLEVLLMIHGYTTPDNEQIGKVNASKRTEEAVLRVIDALATDPEVNPRWLSIGKTHIEQGFMAINRAILKPQRMKGDLQDG